MSAVSGTNTDQIGNGGATSYNEVIWNGKDETGSIMANGTYLYVIVKQGQKEILAKSQIAVLD